MKLTKYIASLALPFLTLGTTLVSCEDGSSLKKDSHNNDTQADATVIIYAVATNSLSRNLVYDKNEMLEAASQIDLDKNNVLVFQTIYDYQDDGTRGSKVELLKLTKTGEDAEWEQIKEYDDEVASLNPSRINEIINYVTENYKADNYGLVFWSHSTASQPYFPASEKTLSASVSDEVYKVSLPMQYNFGQDLTYSKGDPYYMINIEDLANAVPDHLFDFIWFDSCYMSNIETIYQFRNKCNTFVGYPTEVLDDGLPYQYVLPYLVGKSPDPIVAARLFFQYYETSFGTIGVMEMNEIENVADFCRNIYTIGNQVNSSKLMKYSRFSTGPFYDFGDYTKEMAELSGIDLSDEKWENVLTDCVKYKATTSGSLLNLTIYPDRYSGISTHLYSFSEENSEEEAYYKSLDWYKAVFENY